MCRLCRARGVGGPFALVENDPPSSSHVDDDAFVPCRVARSVLAEASPHHHRSHRRVDAPGSAARVARVVVGAGVAGACAAEELCRLAPDDDVVLVAATDAVKAVLDVERVTRRLSVVNVVERPIDSALAYENIRVARGVVTGMDPAARTLTLKLKRAPPTSGDERDARREGEGEGEGDEETTLRYDQLFVCVGAAPVVPEACRGDVAASVTRTVRDVEDVTGLCDALRRARRALLVGNGGIAMEIVGALCGGDGGGGGGGGDDDAPASDAPPPRELVWAHRHSTVGDSFFDRDAGAFLMGLLSRGGTRRDGRSRGGNAAEKTRKRRRRGKDDGDGEDEDAAGVVEGGTSTVVGGAAGPSWVKTMTSALESGTREPFALRPRPDVELRAVEAAGDDDDDADGFAAVAVLSDGERVPVDLIIVAAGVDPAPRVAFLPRDVYARGDDGGVEGAFYLTLVPIRPRSRGERRSLRTLPGDSLRPPLGFNPRPRCLSTPPDAFELHPDIIARTERPATVADGRRGRPDGHARGERGRGRGRADPIERVREGGGRDHLGAGRGVVRGGLGG